VVAVIAIVLGVFVFTKLLGGGATGKTTSVPDITNKTVAQAQAALSANSLKLGSDTCSGDAANNPSVKAGQIISQSPQSGASATSGGAVNYCLSAGALQKKLPETASLNSNTKQTVEQTLTSAGFTSQVESDQTSTTVPAGNVIDLQDGNGKSLAGQVEPVTTQITVVVSSGPGNTTVPPVVGQTCPQADQTLQGAGFQTSTTQQYSADVQPGNAIGTQPGGNAQAGKGSKVTLLCSMGASPSPTPSNSPSPTTSATTGGGLIGGLGGGGGTPTTSPNPGGH
jgi:serine/threonine-protein kinase